MIGWQVELILNLTTLLLLLSGVFYFRSHPMMLMPVTIPRIPRSHLLVFFSFLVPLVTINWNYLNSGLAGDEFYHLQRAHAVPLKIVTSIIERWTFLDGLKFSTVLRSIDFLFLTIFLALAGGIIFIPKRRPLFFFLLILVFHNFIWLSNEAHPPLRHFPVWLATTFFGINNFAAHLPQLLAVNTIMFLAWLKLSSHLGKFNAWLTSATIGSLPVLLHVGTLLEFSVWTVLAALLFFIIFLDGPLFGSSPVFDKRKYILASLVITFFTLIRQPVFLLSAPLVLHFAYYWISDRPNRTLKDIYCLAPLVLMAPFVMKSLLLGTPATYIPGESIAFIPSHLSSPERIWFGLINGMIFNISHKHLGTLGLIFCFLAFIPFKREQWFQCLWLFLSFVALCVPFYLVRPVLWGIGRYTSEYAAPFYILGTINILTSFKQSRPVSILIATGAALVLLLNINDYRNPVTQPVPGDGSHPDHHPRILSKTYYDWDQALQAALKEKMEGSTLLIGVTYGYFPFVLNDFTVKSVKEEKALLKRHGNSPDLEALTGDGSVKLLLVAEGELPSKIDYINELQDKDWKIWRTFISEVDNSKITGLIRPHHK